MHCNVFTFGFFIFILNLCYLCFLYLLIALSNNNECFHAPNKVNSQKCKLSGYLIKNQSLFYHSASKENERYSKWLLVIYHTSDETFPIIDKQPVTTPCIRSQPKMGRTSRIFYRCIWMQFFSLVYESRISGEFKSSLRIYIYECNCN